MLVVVLENPDRFAIRPTEQISCRTSVPLRSRNPNAPRTSTTARTRTIPNYGFGLNTVDYHQLTRISPRPEKQVLGWCSSCELCPGCETFFRRGYW